MVLNTRISNLTITWGIFIIISASFMRYVLNFLIKHIKISGVNNILWILFTVIGILIGIYLYSVRPKILNLTILLLTLFAGLFYAAQMKIVEEKWHLIQFGLLGWMITKDSCNIKNLLSRFVFSMFFGLLVAAIDELFQLFLPTRVADVRDILFGTVGTIWGTVIYLSSEKCKI